MSAANAVASPVGAQVGARVADLEITRAWLVDPATGREGPGEIVVADGVLEAVTWLEGPEAEGVDPSGVIVAPGFVDLHAHLREPGNEDAETVATGLAAAAHGGFTAVCVMPNTTPALDEPSVLARIRDAAAASGSPVALLAHGAVSAGRAGEQLAALGELADAGVVGFSDDGAPVSSASLFRNALAYAGMLGLPIVDHPEDLALTEGAEANEGLVSTVLGLRGWPVAGEAGAVARDLAILADVVADVPRARLHLTHLSTGAALELVRAAKAAGLPVTCDVTPHHLALTDAWVAGARHWSWETAGGGALADDPWRDGAITALPFDPSLRVNPPLRSAADAAACLAALVDGTADAIATDHAPHTEVDKAVEFGLAANGISGLETALGIVLAAVDAGRLPLATAIAALTTGPARVLGGRAPGGGGLPGLVEGRLADLVVLDRGAGWLVGLETLVSKGKNSPLLGRELPGRVLLTVAGGRIAYEAADIE
jgi:dihydroorotase